MYKNTVFILVYFLIWQPVLARKRTYSENLAVHRMDFSKIAIPQLKMVATVQPVRTKKNVALITHYDINQHLDNLLKDLKSYYLMNDSIPGYTIQVYAGGSREMAFKVRNMLYEHYPTYHPEIQYKQPHFTVRIGRFLDRLEAYKWYIPIKKLIPQAIIRPAYFPNIPHIFILETKSIIHTDSIQTLEPQ